MIHKKQFGFEDILRSHKQDAYIRLKGLKSIINSI